MSETIKNCPFCGSSVSVERVPLKHYKGCVIFEIKCLNCGCERTLMKNDSIYRTEEEARANAIAQWNERTPSVDVTPVVKGEWVHRKVWHPLPWDCPPEYGDEYDSESHSRLEDEWHCSYCDYETDAIHKEWWHFCPNCGADMRKEVKR